MTDISSVIGSIPYRMAFAGGWIDQPFVSRLNPTPPGSMVVVAIQPNTRFLDRAGMGTSTRAVAARLWNDRLPAGDPAELVRQLYAEENRDKPEPSGSQDMAGLIYPGVNRLDYDYSYAGGYFPAHVETCTDPLVGQWLERMIYMVPVNSRPAGYEPLGIKNLDPDWIARLGRTGQDCYAAILAGDARRLGDSFNECMLCWETILPQTVRHPTIKIDLAGLLRYYQSRYQGAMYSGCGGGYIYVVADEPVPGGFQVKIRV